MTRKAGHVREKMRAWSKAHGSTKSAARKPRKARKPATKAHVPETFFGYTDIIWSAVPGDHWAHFTGTEPSLSRVVLKKPGWMRHSAYGWGPTKAAAAANLKERRGVAATRFKKGEELHITATGWKKGPEVSWTAYGDFDRRIKTGTWGEVRDFLRAAISRIGGTDAVFFETIELDGKKDGAPIYSLGLGS